jgi:tetratricopeptide (TPR) repeat protein
MNILSKIIFLAILMFTFFLLSKNNINANEPVKIEPEMEYTYESELDFEKEWKDIKDFVNKESQKLKLSKKQSAELFRAKVLKRFNEKLKRDFDIHSLIFNYPEHAVKMFTEEINISSSPESYVYRGETYLEMALRGNFSLYQKAIDDFTKVIQIQPGYNEGRAYYLRGLAYINLKPLKNDGTLNIKAIEDFSEAIKINPKNPFRYQARSSVYLRTKKYKEAAKDLKIFFKLNKDDRYGKRISESSDCKELIFMGYRIKGCQTKDFFIKKSEYSTPASTKTK